MFLSMMNDVFLEQGDFIIQVTWRENKDHTETARSHRRSVKILTSPFYCKNTNVSTRDSQAALVIYIHPCHYIFNF